MDDFAGWEGSRAFFLGDPPESLDQPWDSSLRLMAAHRRRGTPVLWATLDDMLIHGRRLILRGHPVEPRDVVWLRLDPAAALRYHEALRALCGVEATIVNPPAAVLTVHDKRAALELCPRESYGVFSAGQLDGIAARLRETGVSRVVLKPPSLFASRGVRYLTLDDAAALRAAFDDIAPLFGWVVVEPFIAAPDGGHPSDLRVLVTARRVVGMVDRPFDPDLPLRAAPALNAVQRGLVDAAMGLIRARGIFLAGLDFLGDALTEINVTCPGALPEIERVGGGRAEDAILDDLAAWRQPAPRLLAAV
ncbi:MAG: hypothetical protein HQL40_02775 [Alphaproteobacteria bacterium]|nr:hypothetical protein [Alphaproteobacteria bacterium]